MTDFWTVERIDALFAMACEGKSMAQIAAVLGCSKNAVIGKHNRLRDRLGIARPKAGPRKRTVNAVKPEKVSKEPVRVSIPTPAVVAKQLEVDVDPVRATLILPFQPVPEPVKAPGVSIVDVTGCRYAIADDDALIGGKAFCNAPLDGARSYCAEHARIVYTAPAKLTKHKRFRTIPTTLLRIGAA